MYTKEGSILLPKTDFFLILPLIYICLFIWNTQVYAIHPNTIEFVLGMVLCLDNTFHINLWGWMTEP